ncbi:uncharacterized protein LOC133799978 [Humulus lupulus]|uniref:uncharacterized protein LOC133799978 n=1 Tax=Humulus lupulus TaxID=3486 RepID=UPI002B411463|nr:uncharacterized protein LOC133799978 [Humulus lupulus]
MSQAPPQSTSQPPVPLVSQEKTNELQAALLTFTNTQTQFMTETKASIRNLESQSWSIEESVKKSIRLPKLVIEKDEVEEEDKENPEKKYPHVSFKHHIKIPYHERLQKNTLDKQFSKILDIFRKLHINIPFAKALETMLGYVMFVKEILSKKKRLEDYEIVVLTDGCIAILQKKLPPKLKDPSSFAILCTVRNVDFETTHCNLGASVKLMALSIYQKLKLGEVRPTMVTLQMVDRSVKYPHGLIEDVLVKVDKFIFPTYFIILDMEEDANIPIILGRPFLATGKTLINITKGELKL